MLYTRRRIKLLVFQTWWNKIDLLQAIHWIKQSWEKEKSIQKCIAMQVTENCKETLYMHSCFVFKKEAILHSLTCMLVKELSLIQNKKKYQFFVFFFIALLGEYLITAKHKISSLI